MAEYEREQSQKQFDLGKQWAEASDEDRMAWLGKCRDAILDKVGRSFPGFFVDTYSADLYQVAVKQNGYRVERADELKLRLAEYHERASADPSQAGINGIDTSFVVVRRVPLEGNSNNFYVSKYKCDMRADFGVSVF